MANWHAQCVGKSNFMYLEGNYRNWDIIFSILQQQINQFCRYDSQASSTLFRAENKIDLSSKQCVGTWNATYMLEKDHINHVPRYGVH
jgi:hypothetical protein